jgi:peptidoglycan L-alanyl-D-glutamate endopeptidase CwlK
MTRRRLEDRDLTQDIIDNASRLLREISPVDNVPLGTERTFESAGRHYVCVLERHYHPPGGKLRPWGKHKGFSTFEEVDGLALPPTVASPKSGPFVLGVGSQARLKGVHPDLVRVVQCAIQISEIDFAVVEGLRTQARQRELVATGASQSVRSRHLTGHAVDLAPYEGRQVHWDWPRFRKLAPAVFQAAKDCNVPIEWGGNWTSFADGPHWQLPWSVYP